MQLFLSFITIYGLTIFIWSSIGLCRYFSEKLASYQKKKKAVAEELSVSSVILDEVAVLIPAHNEEKTIEKCLTALSRVVPRENIYIGSDGSTDNTVSIVSELGYNIADIQPNGGKAHALSYLIEHFEICARYKAVLIMDADSEIDVDYFKNALPMFDDPEVVAIAGHAHPKWHAHWLPKLSMYYISYRVRLYRLTQALLRYGQTWKYSNVSFIVPGFASMYRTSVLPRINITAPGLIIEDFNMTFELHHRKLGKIAYSPRVVCVCDDPHNIRDYYKQVKRWYLGFWQTVKLHGFWPGLFWLSLGTFIVEMLLQSIIFLTVPIALFWFIFISSSTITLWLPHMGPTDITLEDVLIGVFLVDYSLTIIIALIEKKYIMLLY